MATKIIHVLKSDRVEDIISEFQNTNAQEVIFIVPAKAKFGQKESHFQALNQERMKGNKTVTIMSPSEEIKNFAEKFDFQFISSPKSASLAKAVHSAVRIVEDGDKKEEAEVNLPQTDLDNSDSDEEKEDAEEEFEAGEAVPAASERKYALAELASSKRHLSDIVWPKEQKKLDVNQIKEPPAKMPIDIAPDVDEVEHLWLDRFNRQGDDEESRYLSSLKKGGGASSRKSLFIFAGVCVVALLAVVYSSFGSAQVTIIPLSRELDFQLKVEASSKHASVDTAFNSIPGQYFTVSNTQSRTVQSSGQKEVSQKAKGIITIKNTSGSPQLLVATTRFESPQGLIFRIPGSITVPAGGIDAQVTADQPGDKYNIEPTTFTVPGFKGSPKYNQFSGTSKTAMTGGIVGLANVLTQQDLSEAQLEVRNKALEQAKSELGTKSTGLMVLESLAPSIAEEKADHAPGDAVIETSVTATAEANTVAFKEDDIIKLIDAFIQKTGDLVLIKESLRLDYKNPRVDEATQTLTFDLSVKGKAGVKIDGDNIRQRLVGLKEAQLKEAINAIKEVESARISLSPFWMNRVPDDPDKINLNVEYK